MVVDDRAGEARLHLGQRVAAGGDHHVAADHQMRTPRRDARRRGCRSGALAMRMWLRDRAALLRQAGHVEHRDALALEMRRHAEDRADGHDAGAADAGDQDAVGLVEAGQGGLRQRDSATADWPPAAGLGLRSCRPGR